MTLQQRINALKIKYRGQLSAAFFESIQSIVDNVPMAAIVQAIESQEWERAVTLMSIDRAAFRPVERITAEAFEDVGATTAQALNTASRVRRGARGAQAAFRFDVRSTRAENWLAAHSSAFVTRIVDDTRAAIMLRLQEGMIAGRNPRSVALDIVGRIDPGTGRRIGGIVGLSGPQERYLRNARSEVASTSAQDLNNYLSRQARDKRFDSYVHAALRDGTPIPADVQAKMTARYSDNLLRVRGESIGRTEMIESANRANWESFKQAEESGTVRAVRKVWESAGDDGRTRESHLELDGETVGMDEPFISPVTGAAMMFPGDSSLGASGEDTINCRCNARYDVDF